LDKIIPKNNDKGRAIYGNLENKINTLLLASGKLQTLISFFFIVSQEEFFFCYFRRKYKSSSFLQLCLIMLNQNTHTYI
jgi:hypothetical protein